MIMNIDYFIQITFVLLILSMITEKVTNFVRQNTKDNWLKRTLNWKIKLKPNATLSDFEGLEENQRVREIHTLALLVGVTLAFGCRANLFNIYDPNYALGWIEVDWANYGLREGVSDFFGCGLAGIFLSLGSKFFHDLLGLLLESKNLKRKLNDRDGVANLHTIEEVDTYIAEVEPIVIEKQLSEYLNTIPQVENYEFSYDDSSVDVVLSEISDEDFSKLQRFITVKMANKKTKGIELNYLLL